jgi:hypothetical protein
MFNNRSEEHVFNSASKRYIQGTQGFFLGGGDLRERGT